MATHSSQQNGMNNHGCDVCNHPTKTTGTHCFVCWFSEGVEAPPTSHHITASSVQACHNRYVSSGRPCAVCLLLPSDIPSVEFLPAYCADYSYEERGRVVPVHMLADPLCSDVRLCAICLIGSSSDEDEDGRPSDDLDLLIEISSIDSEDSEGWSDCEDSDGEFLLASLDVCGLMDERPIPTPSPSVEPDVRISGDCCVCLCKFDCLTSEAHQCFQCMNYYHYDCIRGTYILDFCPTCRASWNYCDWVRKARQERRTLTAHIEDTLEFPTPEYDVGEVALRNSLPVLIAMWRKRRSIRAATVIQRIFRGRSIRNKSGEDWMRDIRKIREKLAKLPSYECVAATKIQRIWRLKAEDFRNIFESAARIQALVRGFLHRSIVVAQRRRDISLFGAPICNHEFGFCGSWCSCVSYITYKKYNLFRKQKNILARLRRINHKLKIRHQFLTKAVIVIQRWWRCDIRRTRLYNRRVVLVQTKVRAWLVRYSPESSNLKYKIWVNLEMIRKRRGDYHELRSAVDRSRAVLKIQCLVRGFQVRRYQQEVRRTHKEIQNITNVLINKIMSAPTHSSVDCYLRILRGLHGRSRFYGSSPVEPSSES